jgi:hypothetical protein
MFKIMRTSALIVGGAALAGLLLISGVRAQQLDPGIQALIAALKTYLTATLTTTPVPATTNGWTPYLANGLTTTVTTVKSSAGELGAYHCLNPNSSAAYVQIFDASSVTLGSTTPVLSLGIPATSGGNLEWTIGLHFATAIKVAATTTATGSTAPSTAVDCNFAYK